MLPEELGPQADTLELINAELAARLERQAASGAKIDTKAVVLAGYAVAAVSFLATQHPQPVLAGFAYGAYVMAAGCGISAYAVGSYRDVPDPRGLFNGYATRTKAEALAALGAGRVKAFEENVQKHTKKVWRWRVSLAALAVGVFLMVTSILVQTGLHDGAAAGGQRVCHRSVTAAAKS